MVIISLIMFKHFLSWLQLIIKCNLIYDDNYSKTNLFIKRHKKLNINELKHYVCLLLKIKVKIKDTCQD